MRQNIEVVRNHVVPSPPNPKIDSSSMAIPFTRRCWVLKWTTLVLVTDPLMLSMPSRAARLPWIATTVAVLEHLGWKSRSSTPQSQTTDESWVYWLDRFSFLSLLVIPAVVMLYQCSSNCKATAWVEIVNGRTNSPSVNTTNAGQCSILCPFLHPRRRRCTPRFPIPWVTWTRRHG